MAMLSRAVVRRTGSWRMKRMPSTVPCQNPSGRSWTSGTPEPGTRILAVRTRDSGEGGGRRPRACWPRRRWRSGAHRRRGRRGRPMLHTASWTLLARSRRQPAAWAAAGSRVSRAVTPAGSKAAPRAARTMRQPEVQPDGGVRDRDGGDGDQREQVGHHGRASAAEQSRRPCPTRGWPGSAGGQPRSPPHRPRWRCRCSSRASHGRATMATPLPAPETRVAASSSTRGRRRGLTDPGWQVAHLFPRWVSRAVRHPRRGGPLPQTGSNVDDRPRSSKPTASYSDRGRRAHGDGQSEARAPGLRERVRRRGPGGGRPTPRPCAPGSTKTSVTQGPLEALDGGHLRHHDRPERAHPIGERASADAASSRGPTTSPVR